MSYLKMRKKIEDKILVLDEKAFFLSSDFKKYIENLVQATSMRYREPVKAVIDWNDNENSQIAWTDNNIIWINPGNKMVQNIDSIKKKIVYLTGITAHELGHILYSDFDKLEKFQNRIKNGTFISKPDSVKADEIREYLKNGNAEIIKQTVNVFIFIFNILEDYYIENLMCINFPGTFKKAIEYITFVYELNTDNTENLFPNMINHIIFYTKKGYCNTNSLKKEHEDALKICFEVINDFKKNDGISFEEKEAAAEYIVFVLWQYLKEFLDKINNRDTPPCMKKESEELCEQLLRTLKEVISKADQKNKNENKANQKSKNPHENKSNTVNTANSSLETLSVKNINIDNFIDKEVCSILMNKAEKEVKKDIETELYEDIKEQSQNIYFSETHKNITLEVVRDIEISEYQINSYNSIYNLNLNLLKRLKHNFDKAGKKNRLNNKVYSLREKHFDIRSAYKDEINFFGRKNSSDRIDLAMALLVDESGSMEGIRIDKARETSLIIYDFCKHAGIPLSIYGHTEYLNKVIMYSYAEFDSIDDNDKYRISSIYSKYANRDGMALKFVCERLAERKQKKKVLITISDGQPYASGYYGKSAAEDIRKVKLEYYRRGIVVFAAAIGDDRQYIKEIYKDGYLDITDLEKLPSNLIKLINEYIK